MAQIAIELGLAAFAGIGGLAFLRWLWAAGTPRARRGRAAFFTGAFLLTFALRMHVAAGRVSPLPYLDQWKIDVSEIMLPLGRGESLSAEALLRNHAEHRILPTRLASVALLQLNHEWDNRPLVVLSLAAQSLALAWWATFALVSLRGWRGGVVVALTLLVAALRCDWENIASGFQSQFNFTVLGSLIAFAVLPQARAGPVVYFAGLAALLILLVTLGSGAMTAASVAGILIFGLLVERRMARDPIVTLLACLAIFAVGVFTRPEFHGHDFLHAKSAAEWGQGFLTYGAWPLGSSPSDAWPPALRWGAVLVLWAPSGWLAWHCVRHREADPFARATLALSVWVWLQAATLAWSRFGLAFGTSSRYTGVLVFAGIANAGALASLGGTTKLPRWGAIGFAAAFVLWCGVLAGRWIALSPVSDAAFSDFRAETIGQENRLVGYLRTADPRVITTVDFPTIPYPVKADILKWLNEPGIRAVLPASERRAIFRHDHPGAADAITAGPLTALAKILLHFGPWLLFPGLLLLATGGVQIPRHSFKSSPG